MELVFYQSGVEIFRLISERSESAEQHIRNGYPELLEDFLAGKIIVAEEEC